MFKTLATVTGPDGLAGEVAARRSLPTGSTASGSTSPPTERLPWPEFDSRRAARSIASAEGRTVARAGRCPPPPSCPEAGPCISTTSGSTAGSPSSPAARRGSALPSPRRWPKPGRSSPSPTQRRGARGRTATAPAKGLGVEAELLDVTDSARVTDVADALVAATRPDRHPRQQCRHRAQRNRGRGRRRRALAERPRRQSQRQLLVRARLRPAHAGGGPGRDRQRRLDERLHRQPAAAAKLLQRVQGGGAPADPSRSPPNGRRAACGSTRSRRPTSPRRSTPSPTGKARCTGAGSTARRWAGSARPEEVASVVLFLASDAAEPDDRQHRPGRRRL